MDKKREQAIGMLVRKYEDQQFIILDKDKYDYLRNKVKFSFWEKLSDDRIVVRFATSWATKEEDVEELISIL